MVLTEPEIEQIRQVIKDEVTEVVVEAKRELISKNMEFKDEILGELKDFRDDMAVVSGYSDHLENHEERMAKIETKVGLSSS